MTPAEWLAAIMLSYMVIAWTWRKLEPDVVHVTFRSNFYLTIAAIVQVTVIALSLVILL